MMLSLALLLATVAQPVPISEAAPPTVATPRIGTVTDIDGNTYRTVILGKLEWMAENLRVTRLNDGTAIPLVAGPPEWGALTTPGFAWHGNDAAGHGKAYGALYNWHAIETGRLAPQGWRVPTHAEWTAMLTTVLGGTPVDGGQVLLLGELKSTRTAPDAHPRWNPPNAAASNTTGFGALPGGLRSYVGIFNYLGDFGFWWSSTPAGSQAWYRGMRHDNGHVFMATGHQKMGLSVRCVRDVE